MPYILARAPLRRGPGPHPAMRPAPMAPRARQAPSRAIAGATPEADVDPTGRRGPPGPFFRHHETHEPRAGPPRDPAALSSVLFPLRRGMGRGPDGAGPGLSRPPRPGSEAVQRV